VTSFLRLLIKSCAGYLPGISGTSAPATLCNPRLWVHELYVGLFAGEPVDWQNRAHFMAVAAQQLRRLLIDHARARLAEKREGGQVRVSLTAVGGLAAAKPVSGPLTCC
jgi:ECF sigma factor